MSRTRASRRRYDAERPGLVLGRGLAVLALLLAFAWLAATLYSGVPGRDYRVVDAEVPQIGSLITHDPVRIGGVRVGQVKSIGTAAGGLARLKLQIEPGTEIPSDTKIRLRANGLLGARFIELVPGASGQSLPEGAVIRGDEHSLTYGATDALDVLDRQTRRALRPLLGELGTGLMGQGTNVNDLLRVGGDEIGPTSDLFHTLAGPSSEADRLLPSLQSGMVGLDDARHDLTALFGAGSTALQPFVSQRQATRDTLGQAPATLSDADGGLSAARPLLLAARSLSAQVRTTLPDAPPGLRSARALLIEARTPLRKAKPLLNAVTPTVPAALKLTGALSPVLKPLTNLFGDVESMAHKIGPYGCDIVNFGAVFRSMTGLGSAGPGGPGGPAMQFRLQAAAPLPAEVLSQVDTSGLIVRDGYPRPCQYLAKPYPIIQRPQALGRGR